MIEFTEKFTQTKISVRPEEISYFGSHNHRLPCGALVNERVVTTRDGNRFIVLDDIQLIRKKMDSYRMGLEAMLSDIAFENIRLTAEIENMKKDREYNGNCNA